MRLYSQHNPKAMEALLSKHGSIELCPASYPAVDSRIGLSQGSGVTTPLQSCF